MKKIIIISIMSTIVILFLCTSMLYAWRGDTWETESRETIIRIADEMVDFTWGPMKPITNWNYDNVWYTFNRNGIYRGEAYSQTGYPNNDQANWSEFTNYVYYTNGGNTYYGNDCSGFVSMSWKLPTRYNTTAFESDATSSGGYVMSLGAIGSGKNISLLRGDALVKSGSHIILFESYLPDGTGINAIEQTSVPSKGIYWAVRNKWTWANLTSYRPIRRNNLTEDNYVFTTKWGTPGTSNRQFNYPTDIAVDSAGNVFVVDSLNDRIQKFNSNGDFITKWGVRQCGTAWCGFPGNPPCPPQQGYELCGPSKIAVDSSGNIYVNNSYLYPIKKYSNNGNYIMGGFSNFSQINPEGIAANLSGNIYVGDSSNDCIKKFTSNGGLITQWGSYGSGNKQFNDPYGITVSSSGNVYVADTFNNRIQKFDSNGGFITQWGGCCSPNGYFNVPYGITVDSSENVYVADTYNHRIQKFNSDGIFLTKWGSNGYMEGGEFQYPEGVAVDSSGNVYVADTYNHRIQKFSLVSPQPSAPTDLAADRASTTSIKLTWKDNSNSETGFKIIRKTTYMGLYSTVATVGPNATSYTDTGLTYGMQYFYAVSAFNNNGESAYSNEDPGGTY
ncbi:MAG: fibronectin type III domain-containing protein [Thermodesulfovibrionales bacterium]